MTREDKFPEKPSGVFTGPCALDGGALQDQKEKKQRDAVGVGRGS